jgi:hypothetical protein
MARVHIIATATYRKKPEGTSLFVAPYEAKALVALRQATYATKDIKASPVTKDIVQPPLDPVSAPVTPPPLPDLPEIVPASAIHDKVPTEPELPKTAESKHSDFSRKTISRKNKEDGK